MTLLEDTTEDTAGSKLGQEVSRRCLAAETRVPSQASLFTICGGNVLEMFMVSRLALRSSLCRN